jgi:Holliday junction resolvasome RuvABC endonuclease subunit
MNYIGIDQSYTSTGFIALDENKTILDVKTLSTPKDDDIFKRSWDMSEMIVDEIKKYPECELAIEGLAFSMRGNATRDLAGLQFSIINKIKFVLNKEITIIAPPTLKKSATGYGKASKEQMIEALPKDVYELFTGPKNWKKSRGLTDVTDAYFLARHLIENDV